MTSPESASPSRPAKAAGFALLGVAAVALIIGVVSLFGGGSDTPSADGSSTAPPPPQQTTTGSPTVPTDTSVPPAATTTTVPPVSSAEQPPPPPVTQPGAVKVPVRVYNNSTITGLASKAADEVRANGWTVADTGNYAQGTIPTTTVYYRPGTDEEASAKELARVLRARVEPRFTGIEQSPAGVILIVTNDFQGASKNK